MLIRNRYYCCRLFGRFLDSGKSQSVSCITESSVIAPICLISSATFLVLGALQKSSDPSNAAVAFWVGGAFGLVGMIAFAFRSCHLPGDLGPADEGEQVRLLES